MPDSPKSTLVACVTSSFLTVPSLLFGTLMSFLYKFFLAGIVGTLFWVPFFETLRAIVVTGFGGGLLGMIAAGGPIMVAGSGLEKRGQAWVRGVVLGTLALTFGCAAYFGLLSSLEGSYLDMFGGGFGWLDGLAFVVGAIGVSIGAQPEQ